MGKHKTSKGEATDNELQRTKKFLHQRAKSEQAGNKGIEFLKGNRHIGVPKKDPNAAPAVDTKNMKAGAASTYRIALGNQSWDVQVQTLSK